MTPRPQADDRDYRSSGKLRGKAALITRGDSGMGRAVAIAFAKEGADVAIAYLREHGDAQQTRALVEKEGRRCVAIAGDVGDERFCQHVVQDTVRALGRLDILVNNAAEQHPQESLEDITGEQLERTFRTNIFSVTDRPGAIVHGVLVWVLFSLFTLRLLANGVSLGMSGLFSAMGGLARGAAEAVGAGGDGFLGRNLTLMQCNCTRGGSRSRPTLPTPIVQRRIHR